MTNECRESRGVAAPYAVFIHAIHTLCLCNLLYFRSYNKPSLSCLQRREIPALYLVLQVDVLSVPIREGTSFSWLQDILITELT